jgi:hypothetical protein
MYEALDIETLWIDNIAKPICIAISNNNRIDYLQINKKDIDSDLIINFLLKKCSSKKIYYVHNLTFEMFVFIKYFIKFKIKFKMISSNKTIYSAEITKNKKKIKLRCSYKLTLLSLKNFAKLAEIEEKFIFPYKILDQNIEQYMEIKKEYFNNSYDYTIFVNKYGNNPNIFEILKEYCINDTYITKKAINRFWNIITENGLKNNTKILTAAKLSIENYFITNTVVKKKIPLKYDRLIRKGYFGGRTEVFGNPLCNEIMLHYDWNGMYAQCMSEKVLGGEIVKSNKIYNLEQPGFYYIEFFQDLEFPILPIKYNNKLMFLNGNLQGWYWFEEILLAINYGIKILKILDRVSCEYYDYFIKDFITKNNEIRKISILHKQIGKNNNNTFYGRLGMDPERLEEEIISNLDNKKYVKTCKINDVYLGYTNTEKNVSNVLISASITAKARIKLYKGMMNVIGAGGRLLYTDTDSIIAAFNINKYKNILDKNLGEVIFNSNDEHTIIQDAVFAMPKTYAIKYSNKEIVKIKGFNNVPNFDLFKKTFYEKGTIETENSEWNKKDFNIRNIKRIKKTNLFSLDKRLWDETLKNTLPLKI